MTGHIHTSNINVGTQPHSYNKHKHRDNVCTLCMINLCNLMEVLLLFVFCFIFHIYLASCRMLRVIYVICAALPALYFTAPVHIFKLQFFRFKQSSLLKKFHPVCCFHHCHYLQFLEKLYTFINNIYILS